MKPTYEEFMACLSADVSQNDPFWLAKEYTRLDRLKLARESQEVNAELERIARAVARVEG